MLITYSVQILSLGVVTVYYLLKNLLRSSRTPSHPRSLPGPWGLPWAGPVWAVDATSIYKTFAKWAEQYGSIYQVTVFGASFAVISDPEIAKDILAKKGAIASDRPSIALLDNTRDSGKYLPFLGHNDLFHKQRRFGVLMNAYTHQSGYHQRFSPELKRFLLSLLNKSDDYDALLDKCCARISCWLAFGEPAFSAEITRNSHNLMKNLSPGGRVTNVLTFLRHLPAWLSTERAQEIQRREKETILWTGIFDVAKKSYEQGTLQPCYARYYFENKAKLGLNLFDATYGVGMMVNVAILTITAPTLRFIIALTMHPQWQLAVQAELDEVIGNRLPAIEDAPQLPIVRAVILESMRWTSPLPTGIPHRIEQDIEYNGYLIPAGTNIMACDWAMARNPKVYTDPATFNPNRWLSPDFPTYRTPLTEFPKIQGHHAFGFGRRICIGQDLAANEVFVICAAMLWAFNLKPGVDKKTGRPVQIDIGNATPHVIPIPEKQNIVFEARSRDRAELIVRIAGHDV